MKEFIEKLIGRLEEETDCPNCSMYCADANICGFDAMRKQAIEIVNQLAEEYKGGWIPCNKKLPKNWEYVHATCISLIDDREPWVIEGFYNNIPGWKELTPMIYLGHAEVIAWKPYKLPAPYKPKGE